MIRFGLSIVVFSILALVAGAVMADDGETVEWPVAGGLIAAAVAGEGLRTWIRSRGKQPTAER
jgi:hypothetical protein